MRRLTRLAALGAIGLLGGCASFQPKSSVQRDSSGTSPNSTGPSSVVRTARFANDPNLPGTLPPVQPAYAAQPVVQPAVQPGMSVAPAAQPTFTQQPQYPQMQIQQPQLSQQPQYQPSYAQAPLNQTPILQQQYAAQQQYSNGYAQNVPQYQQQPNYAPVSSQPVYGNQQPQVMAATSNRWPTTSTGSSFIPAGNSAPMQNAMPIQSGAVGMSPQNVVNYNGMPQNGIPQNGMLTPSQPLAQRIPNLKLHPEFGNGTPDALAGNPPPRAVNQPNYDVPATPTTARREPQPQIAAPRTPALDDDRVERPQASKMPPLDDPSRNPTRNPIKEMFTPSRDELAPNRQNRQDSTIGSPFEQPARPNVNSNRPPDTAATGTKLEPPAPASFQPSPPAKLPPKNGSGEFAVPNAPRN